MNISVVIPSYNEKENIEKIIKIILNQFKIHKVKGEIIVVDDDSPDGTANIVRKMKYKNVRLIVRKKERGKGSAVIRGARAAKYDIVAMIDSDLQYPPKDIYKLAKSLEKNNADIVIGKRIYKSLSLKRKIASSGFKMMQRSILGLKISDTQSGLKVFRKKVFNIKIKEGGFTFDLELLLKANKKNFKIIEVPINFYERKQGQTKINTFYHGLEFFWKSIYLKMKYLFYSD